MARASDSLLSDGRRLPIEGAWDILRGNAEGHSVLRPSLDESETCESFRESMLGRV